MAHQVFASTSSQQWLRVSSLPRMDSAVLVLAGSSNPPVLRPRTMKNLEAVEFE